MDLKNVVPAIAVIRFQEAVTACEDNPMKRGVLEIKKGFQQKPVLATLQDVPIVPPGLLPIDVALDYHHVV